MKRPELPAYNQTPIAIISCKTAAGDTAFRDESPVIAGQKFAEHLTKPFFISREAEDKIALAFSRLAEEFPRSIYQKFPKNLSFVDRMKAIGQMPADLGAQFEDGEGAEIETRHLFKLLSKARSTPALLEALSPPLRSRSKKIRHAMYTIPKASGDLSEMIFHAFANNGVEAVHERGGGGFNYVHILTYATRTNNEFTAMAKKLASSDSPFALGAHATMLSPTAWAIIRGLSFYGFGRTGVESGNAACGKRAGTAPLRKLKSYWTEAARTLFYYKVSSAPHGYDDIAAIPFAPSADVLQEIENYTDHVWPQRFNSQNDRGIAKMIRACLELQLRRSKPVPDDMKQAA
jgi:hypothetical protein